MFWERLCKLCEANNCKPNTVAKALGLSTAAATYWKRGSVPNGDVLLRIANYFHVTTDYLLGNSAMPTPEQIDSFTKETVDLTPDERSKVEEYIKFIKSQRQ